MVWRRSRSTSQEKLNAFNEAMHRELAQAFDRIEADAAIRAVLLTGAGRGFCAGQDLGDRMVGAGDAPPTSATPWIERSIR